MKVLYVARDQTDSSEMCPGSTACLAILKSLPEDMINIQDCDILRQSQALPDWLDGTPLYIDQNEGIPHRGRLAIKALQKKLKMYTKSTPVNVPNVEKKQDDPAPRITTDANNFATPNLEDDFKISVEPMSDDTSSSKITEDELNRYIAARNQSSASAQPKPPT
jgi:hypothetical protein